jgi:hypothetical protein
MTQDTSTSIVGVSVGSADEIRHDSQRDKMILFNSTNVMLDTVYLICLCDVLIPILWYSIE